MFKVLEKFRKNQVIFKQQFENFLTLDWNLEKILKLKEIFKN